MLQKNMLGLILVIFAFTALCIGSSINSAEAIWPFDQGNSSQQSNQTGNQSSMSSSPTTSSQSGNQGY